MPGRRAQGAGPGAGAGTDKGGRRGRKGRRGSVDQEAVSSNISRTMSALRGTGGGRRGRRSADSGPSREELAAMRAAEAERERLTIRVNEFVTVSELADIIKVPATQIVAFAFKTLGLMVTINQRLDFDQIELIANEFGFEAVREEEYASDLAEVVSEEDAPESLVPRPPVVTIMGHVDHGKTSLLDYIRRANVVAGESGGITQHIGAYHVQLPDGRLITFLDTPGHEAFTAMRARGAQVTDIVVLVVAADDQVMPQTVEAISHARNAGVPIVVAINKIDLPSADVAKVKQELLQHNVVVEEFGGDTLATEISAKKGVNVDQLLEQILLQAEILDLKANPDRNATGVVVEAQLDPGKGPVATVLVQSGTLKVGDDFIVGLHAGRVRALLDERGRSVEKAGPAIPVQVLGLSGVPMAGDQFIVVDDSQTAREIAGRRERLDREARSRRTSKSAVTLEDFMAQAQSGEVQSLRLLIKADQGGPAEALADALQQLSNDEVRVEVIHRGVGAISESDILLAKASGAVIIGFHVRPDNNARAAAEREGVDVKLYRVIYDAVTDVRAALEGLLSPEQREVVLGEAEVRDTFKVPRAGTIAGCFVRSGIIVRNGRARVIRDGVEIYDGSIESLRRFKDDVREVREGYECGIGIENFNDIKVGDVIECYRTEEIARTLDSAASSHQG
jgi:translation initiation factor IF-2